MPFSKDDYHKKKDFWFTRHFKNLFGLTATGYNENIFEHAGVLWQGSPDGTVDNNPICIRCFTQLSFENKDTVICDNCHKSGDTIGSFDFKLKGVSISYAETYESAKNRWSDILMKKGK